MGRRLFFIFNTHQTQHFTNTHEHEDGRNILRQEHERELQFDNDNLKPECDIEILFQVESLRAGLRPPSVTGPSHRVVRDDVIEELKVGRHLDGAVRDLSAGQACVFLCEFSSRETCFYVVYFLVFKNSKNR